VAIANLDNRFTIIIAVPVSRYAFSQPRALGSGSALVSYKKRDRSERSLLVVRAFNAFRLVEDRDALSHGLQSESRRLKAVSDALVQAIIHLTNIPGDMVTTSGSGLDPHISRSITPNTNSIESPQNGRPIRSAIRPKSARRSSRCCKQTRSLRWAGWSARK
jgi:K+-transporting ATPase C subunit